ncbi:hypothetical protein [Streptacidiphilus melanogenes]|uniref:hypothetical protein n=1 Tax=Streptacidiphilus melanogenes TaxID=411235 RepID=UPI001269CC6C|nr:hypothetical protein [Streptacidiphilus melanogenes]
MRVRPFGKHRKLGCLGLGVLMGVLTVGTATGVVLWLRQGNAPPQPRFLSRTALIGTWRSANDGELRIQADGTFKATEVCGVGDGEGMGSDSGTWGSGPGEWSALTYGITTGGLDLMGRAAQAELDEGKDGAGDPVLWMFRDAPGDSPICELHKE